MPDDALTVVLRSEVVVVMSVHAPDANPCLTPPGARCRP